ncbi:MAG: FAD:protein FMN transferase [Erysipelotrichaceae bacterium]|nr:FAD:protein FMN transferase [Erysipelotrichaceae bacterium]
MKLLKTFCCLCLILSLCGCNDNTQQTEKNYTQYSKMTIMAGFDTIITLVGYTESEDEFNAHFSYMESRFSELNRQFDCHNAYDGVNNVYTINEKAGIEPVPVDEELFDLILLAKEAYNQTYGAFDATMGATLKVWESYREKALEQNAKGITKNIAVPSQEELEATYSMEGWEYVELNETDKTVFITSENVSLDLGGIAKGYATELVARELQQHGLVYGAINGGGNVKIFGAKPDGSAWKVGIAQPDKTNDNVGLLYVDKEMSCVTSGDYQRYFEADGIRYGHIIDPYTLYPASHCRSVTVVMKDSGWADVLSTALFVLDYDSGLQLLQDFAQLFPDDVPQAYYVFDKTNYPETTKAYGLTIGKYFTVPTTELRSSIKEFGAQEK